MIDFKVLDILYDNREFMNKGSFDRFSVIMLLFVDDRE